MRPVTFTLSALMVVLGLALIGRTLAAGGGPAAIGILLGVLLCLAGAGRLYVERKRS